MLTIFFLCFVFWQNWCWLLRTTYCFSLFVLCYFDTTVLWLMRELEITIFTVRESCIYKKSVEVLKMFSEVGYFLSAALWISYTYAYEGSLYICVPSSSNANIIKLNQTNDDLTYLFVPIFVGVELTRTCNTKSKRLMELWLNKVTPVWCFSQSLW